MSDSGDWVDATADQIRVGDVVRLAGGGELTVSRIDTPFFGIPEMAKLVESTSERWVAYGTPLSAPVQVRRAAAADDDRCTA
jgi:hypothetical protein